MSTSVASGAKRIAALRLALRLARRETLRRPWRTILAALLIAVPVAGMVLGAVWVRTEHQTPLERWQASRGHADLYVAPDISRGAPLDAGGVPPAGGASFGAGVPLAAGGETLEDLLPPGSRSVTYREEWSRLLRTTAGARSTVEVTDLPMADPLVAPMIHVIAGRAPTHADEVFLTRKVARALGVAVGEGCVELGHRCIGAHGGRYRDRRGICRGCSSATHDAGPTRSERGVTRNASSGALPSGNLVGLAGHCCGVRTRRGDPCRRVTSRR